jgi:predicted phage replisome organizer
LAKRYYWLKLPDDWFRQKPIKKLRKIAGGDTYTIIYLKMLLVAIKQDGKLYFDGVEDVFYEELALDIDEDPENVKVTVAYLLSQRLMELVNEDEYVLPESLKLTGSESASAERMRRLRSAKASQCDITVTQPLHLSDGEKEIEIEKDKRDIKTFCPEPDKSGSGPQPMVETGPAAVRAVQGIDSRAGMMVEKAAEPSPEVFIQLPLNDGTMYDVTRDYVEEKKKLYPAVDVEQELRKMRGWCDDNPANRKTARGVKRFINGWLTREQDRAPRRQQQAQMPRSTNRFNNFAPSNTDWESVADQVMAAQERAWEKGGGP